MVDRSNMRSARLLLLPLVVFFAACGPGPDPSLATPCAQRKAGTVLVGTGSDKFEAVGSNGVKINNGPQGGQHIWIGLRCQNLGPKVVATISILDMQTGILMSQTGLASVVELEYNPDAGAGTDETGGIYGYLSLDPPFDGSGGAGGAGGAGGTGGIAGAGGGMPKATLPSDLTGRKVKLVADVTDDCKKPPVHGETMATITGYQ
jgi:hypothetical protein